jgi:NADH-quinone oxidoreductase subunit L
MEHAAHHLAPLATQSVSFLWLIPLFPLLGAFINAALGVRLQRKFGKGLVHSISIGAMVLSFAVACIAFFKLLGLDAEHRFLQDTLWNIFTAGKVQVDLGFALDPLSMMMTLIITFIGTLIHVFSTGYMADEPSYWRFFAYLNLFVFSMLLLVMGDNFVLMFFGWEGVGLCSYSADRVLVHGFAEGGGRHESLRRQPLRRLRFHPWLVSAVLGAGWCVAQGRRRQADVRRGRAEGGSRRCRALR